MNRWHICMQSWIIGCWYNRWNGTASVSSAPSSKNTPAKRSWGKKRTNSRVDADNTNSLFHNRHRWELMVLLTKRRYKKAYFHYHLTLNILESNEIFIFQRRDCYQGRLLSIILSNTTNIRLYVLSFSLSYPSKCVIRVSSQTQAVSVFKSSFTVVENLSVKPTVRKLNSQTSLV